MILRIAILATLAVFMVGCNQAGSAEANGDTKSLVKEIPPPQPGGKVFTPEGHSMLKGDTPDKQAAPKGGPDVKGTPKKAGS